ncbi:MAG: hypothetical protein ACI8RD_001189, partial [Bacillariaceae sp.]
CKWMSYELPILLLASLVYTTKNLQFARKKIYLSMARVKWSWTARRENILFCKNFKKLFPGLIADIIYSSNDGKSH